jgi:hypothetical protein
MERTPRDRDRKELRPLKDVDQVWQIPAISSEAFQGVRKAG